MKKIIACALALMLLVSAAFAEVPAGVPGEKMGFELLQKIYAEGENIVFSPLSLAVALDMAAKGAEGETRAQLLAALGLTEADAAIAVPEDIRSANAVFVRPELEVYERYIEALEQGYAPEWFEIDKKVVDRVNRWVRKKTDGLIDGMLSSSPDPMVVMLLINAIAMDAEWYIPFLPENTREQDFHAATGDVTAEMMRRTAYYDYAGKNGVQIIRLPYADSSLEMWIALPEAGGMEEMLAQLAAEGMDGLMAGAERTEVRLTMPKLDISGSYSLAELLQELGLSLPFGAEADFSGIADGAFCISDIIQKARLQADEEGTRAAASTMVSIMATSAYQPEKPEPVELTLDRPFFYAVRDGQTGALCFAGVVENPAAK